ncbi:Histone H1 [Operophtera brumata]|uniref:Histone H1 n=1 Tax=Operophtera brumata TaxID=104452 RepID=A0A0L7LFZ8_OPEBR|nr:Histone H1 [Operophtera brumata]
MLETESESDIEIRSALPKIVNRKPPTSPSDDLKNNPKKITTKAMITDALVTLNTRKGVSVYAIKKYLTEKFDVNTDKVNYLIKKSLKAGVEDGTFVQMKGIGASGSFKIANVKKPKKKKKENTDKIEKANTEPKKTKEPEKPKKMKIKKNEEDEEKPAKKKDNPVKKMVVEIIEKKTKDKNKNKMEEKSEKKEVKIKKTQVKKLAKGEQAPAEKSVAKKIRKSVGNIIKPPKMKPKSRP